MDILFGNLKVSESKHAEFEEKAPIELMSNFLLLVSTRKMKDALKLCIEILQYEPNNKMLLEYKKSLTEYVAQGLDEESPEVSEDEEEDNDEDDESDAKSGSDNDEDD